jgi:hypothetical protein
VREYYSCFDYLRQQKLVSRVEKMWSADPLTKQLSLGARVAPVF